MDEATELRIVWEYERGAAASRLARLYHLQPAAVYQLLRRGGCHVRNRKEAARFRADPTPPYMPTPEEVARAAAKIRRRNLKRLRASDPMALPVYEPPAYSLHRRSGYQPSTI